MVQQVRKVDLPFTGALRSGTRLSLRSPSVAENASESDYPRPSPSTQRIRVAFVALAIQVDVLKGPSLDLLPLKEVRRNTLESQRVEEPYSASLILRPGPAPSQKSSRKRH